MTEVWLALSAGLVGSVHCLGMCGGIVAALSLTRSHGTLRTRFISQVFYNLGRITTYTLLGVVAGLFGSTLNLLALKSVAAWFFCVANFFVIGVGLASALRLQWFNLSSLEMAPSRYLTQPFKMAVSGNSCLSFFPLGLCLGFLPCGLIYGPLMVAAGSGSPVLGGSIMAALGIGTMPVLLLFGSASATVSVVIRDRLFRLLGVLIALMGMAGLWRVLGKMGYLSKFPLW
jgi:sulfite exporter TauE/SafE